MRAAFYLLFLEEISSVILASLFPSQFVMLPAKTFALKKGNKIIKTKYLIATLLLMQLYLFTVILTLLQESREYCIQVGNKRKRGRAGC